ncbi:pectin lyase-like superfamily protein [Striga asiatica]|uniref:Pectin lyase-like superfamily protein n=1 Tax=Striga asiatica TaxID=4170 RepID=A0A5A7QQN0_STRAF|nr:pectin lyase-like superfamily protein [Striga asiatica]
MPLAQKQQQHSSRTQQQQSAAKLLDREKIEHTSLVKRRYNPSDHRRGGGGDGDRCGAEAVAGAGAHHRNIPDNHRGPAAAGADNCTPTCKGGGPTAVEVVPSAEDILIRTLIKQEGISNC